MATEVYLDNAATTRPYPEVVAAVSEALTENWGNPSSNHGKGREAKALLEQSRVTIAEALGVDTAELFFTSGGTEANNLGILGSCWAAANPGRRRETPIPQPGQVITSSLEHPSVTKTVRTLKHQGWQVDYIDAIGGDFDFSQLRALLGPKTALISIMAVQNELGYVFPLQQIAALRNELAPQALFHSDAIQAFGHMDFSPSKLGLDLAAISAHKIGGPKGVGALYVKAGTRMFTTAHGGGQEHWLRSGTEALPLIAGFAAATRITFAECQQNQRRTTELRDYLLKGLQVNFPDVIVNSRPDGVSNIISFTLPGWDNAAVVDFLSERSIYLSTASACENNEQTVPEGTWRFKQPLILQTAGISEAAAKSTFRVGLAPENSAEDIDALINALGAYQNA